VESGVTEIICAFILHKLSLTAASPTVLQQRVTILCIQLPVAGLYDASRIIRTPRNKLNSAAQSSSPSNRPLAQCPACQQHACSHCSSPQHAEHCSGSASVAAAAAAAAASAAAVLTASSCSDRAVECTLSCAGCVGALCREQRPHAQKVAPCYQNEAAAVVCICNVCVRVRVYVQCV
jgi:hypothetical protein